jgi:hypothetical protein
MMSRCQDPADAFCSTDVGIYWLQEKPSLTFSFWLIPRWSFHGDKCSDESEMPLDYLSICSPQWRVQGLSGCCLCWDLWGNNCDCYCTASEVRDEP